MTIKSNLARFEQTIQGNEMSGGSTSKSFVNNVGKDPAPRSQRNVRGTKKQQQPRDGEETVTSYLTEDQTVSSFSSEGANIFDGKSSDELIIGMKISEVVAETKDVKDDKLSESTDKKPKTEATNDEGDGRSLMMTWDEVMKDSLSQRKPQQNIEGSVSLKDRMRSFNASCSSMGGVMEDCEMSMSSLNAVVPSVQTKNQVATDNGTNTGHQQQKAEVQVTLKESETEADDLGDYEASMSSLNAIVPSVQTKSQVSTDNGTNTDHQHGTAEEKLPKASAEKDIGKGKTRVKSHNNEDTKDRNNKNLTAAEIKKIMGGETTYKQPWTDATNDEGDDRSLMMTWDELMKASTSKRNGQKDTGGSLSLKDRMRSFNASCSSMGGATDSEVGETYESWRAKKIPQVKTEDESSDSRGDKVQATLKESETKEDDLGDYETSMSSLNAVIPSVQTKNQVATDNGTNMDHQQGTTEEKLPEASAEKEIPTGNTRVKPHNENTKNRTWADATSDEGDERMLMMNWGDVMKASTSQRKGQHDTGGSVSLKDRMLAFNASCSSMGGAMDSPHGSQQDLGESVSLKDRMLAFNESCSSMGGATDGAHSETYESRRAKKVPEVKTENETPDSRGDEVQATIKESETEEDDVGDDSLSLLNAIIPSAQITSEVSTDNGTNTDYRQDTAEEKLPEASIEKDIRKVNALVKPQNEDTKDSTAEEKLPEASIEKDIRKVNAPVKPQNEDTKDITTKNLPAMEIKEIMGVEVTDKMPKADASKLVENPPDVAAPSKDEKELKKGTDHFKDQEKSAEVPMNDARESEETPKQHKPAKPADTTNTEDAKAVNLEFRRKSLACFDWYKRMAQPNRADMKRRVADMPESCGITVADIDRLPWVNGDKRLDVMGIQKLIRGK
jgi:hypothetical protein